jgi:hypothetical protein
MTHEQFEAAMQEIRQRRESFGKRVRARAKAAPLIRDQIAHLERERRRVNEDFERRIGRLRQLLGRLPG